ncbi:MAG: hypothetical protein WA322_05330 [Pseudolabrys sp.]
MKKILTIALVLGGVFVNVMASPIKTVGETDMGNVVVIRGLHVSLPSDMKNFPVELVPQP